MGYCHRCQHDCSEKDPCPCCRGSHKHPWYPDVPYPHPDKPFNPWEPPRKPLRYWSTTTIGGSPDVVPKGYKTTKTTTRLK